MRKDSLLIELRTEELPPKALDNLAKNFASLVVTGLSKERLVFEDVAYQVFATFRRLAVLVPDVSYQQATKTTVKKGPSLARAMEDGKPSRALQGFLKSNGITFEDLSVIHDGKQEVYVYQYEEEGKLIAPLLESILEMAVKKLPIPKLMHWGDKPYTFVRPVHGLVVLYGKEVLSVDLLGLKAGNTTLGHRFMSSQEVLTLAHAGDYEKVLEQNHVIANFDTRRAIIKQQIADECTNLSAECVADESLFSEVTGLVEWPVVLKGSFEAEFLEVPPECLILTMQKNQKYFPLLDEQKKLLNSFLLVSNIESQQPEEVIAGNERVLRARLSDAAFFYQVDLKNSLESRLENLKKVIYHNQIGSQYERVRRLSKISGAIAEKLAIDVELTSRSAELAKADLATEMVGEFPELQGTMGKYYALNDQESPEVAGAIEQHYWPRFANDDLPKTKIAMAVALADKLEALVGIWGIGLIPTGDKDPYALRRAALGVIRILLNLPLNIVDLLEVTKQSFEAGLLAGDPVGEVYEFILTRLSIYLQNEYSHAVVAAAVSTRPEQFDHLAELLSAIDYFKELPEAHALAEINKRVAKLLKKVDFVPNSFDPTLIKQTEEEALLQAIEQVSNKIEQALKQRAYQQALTVLAEIKPKVDAFFDGVMVMTEDEQLKQNRLNLLYLLAKELNAVADISHLSQ